MQRTLDDIEGRFVFVPAEDGVSLAEIHKAQYPMPDQAAVEYEGDVPRIVVHPGYYEYPDVSESARDVEFANRTPFSVVSPEVAEGARPFAGPSFADLTRTIDATENSAIWDAENDVLPNAAPWSRDDGRVQDVTDSSETLPDGFETNASPDALFEDRVRNPDVDADLWNTRDAVPSWHVADPPSVDDGALFDNPVRDVSLVAAPELLPIERLPPSSGYALDGASPRPEERYGGPPDRIRAISLGAFEIPGMRDDFAEWGPRAVERSIAEPSQQLAAAGNIRNILRALFGRSPGRSTPGPASKPSVPAKPAEPGVQSTHDILNPGGQPIGTRHRGAGEEVRTTSPSDFDAIHSRLKSGSKPAEPPPGYQGPAFERSDGITIGERISEQHGRTLEVLRSNDPRIPQGFKVHQK